MLKYLATADLCISPDPKNGLNEFHTMNKTLEYMSMGKPQVCFDLQETRVSAGDSALYAKPNDVKDFALKINNLLNDSEMRERLGRIGYNRIMRKLSWDHSQNKLLEVYDHLYEKKSI